MARIKAQRFHFRKSKQNTLKTRMVSDDTEKRLLGVAERANSDPESIDPIEVIEAIKLLPGYYRKKYNRVSIRKSEDLPLEWWGFETPIWMLGDSIRRYLVPRKELRGRCAILDAVRDLVVDRRNKKGRQSFVGLLGDFGRGEYSDTLGSVLSDPDVNSHAIAALRKASCFDYTDNIKILLKSDSVSSLFRSEAKKYLKKSGVSPDS